MSDVSFPNEDAAPKPGKAPKYRKTETNWADKEELVDRVRRMVSKCQTNYEDQAERTSFVERAEVADRMARCSRVRNTGDRQYQNTQSNVASTKASRIIDVLTAIENDLYFPQSGEQPVGYDPYPGSDEYTASEGREISDAQNLLLEYTFEIDDIERKTRDSLYFLNKYGQQAYALEWDYRVERRRKREVASRYEPDLNLETGESTPGRPKSWRVTEKDFVIANNPTVRGIDLDHLFFDARIDDMQMQSCIAERSFSTLSDAVTMQKSGHYMNVGKVGQQELYSGNKDIDMLADRQANADEGTSEQDESTLLEKWDGWVRVPVSKDGKWDEENEYPEWHWATFFGNIHGDAVCVRLIRNPYFHNKNPYNLVHAMRDDKGAFHVSPMDKIESLYEEHCTAKNQYFDNKTLLNKKPWLVQKNNTFTTDFTFDNNKIFHVRNLEAIKEVPVVDSTQTTGAVIDRIERDIEETLGIEASILGQAFGSRTSATEAETANANALKPLLEKADYQGQQLFPWMAEMIMELWRQYSDPNTTITILRGNMPKEIKPAELWGSLKTKLTAIDRFQDSIARRAEQNSFNQVMLPILAPVMGNQGLMEYGSQLIKDRNIVDDVQSIFPANDTFDAKHVAQSENQSIYVHGVQDIPKEGENHDVHLKEHKRFREMVALMPKEQINPQTLALLDQHILATEQLVEQAQQAQSMQQQGGVQGPGEQASLGGEASGDAISGLQGGVR